MTRLQAALFQPIDILPLIYLRVAFGAVMIWEVWRYATKGWIERYYITPTFHFKYYGFEWINPLPGDGMYWLFALMGLLAILILTGTLYRLSAALFFICFSYVFLLDQARYLNHFYLVILLSFLLIFMPANRAHSVDSWLRSHLRKRTVPAWTLWSFRLQLGIVYFYAGIAKINVDWLRGEPMRMWLAARTDFPLIGQYFTEEWVVYLASYGGLLIDLLAFPLLLWKRSRLLMMFMLVIFHLSNARLFNIGIFPWLMIALLPLFFATETWGRWLPFVNSNDTERSQLSLTGHHYVVIGLLTIYFTFQIFIPLRHHLYPGDVAWTEEGHRFSWRMKLRTKAADIRFYLTDVVANTREEINPYQYLTPGQIEEFSTRPDMILQFAHYLAEQPQYAGKEVNVWTLVSLNGRPPSLLIDPSVNLAAKERSLFNSADWILPMNAAMLGWR